MATWGGYTLETTVSQYSNRPQQLLGLPLV